MNPRTDEWLTPPEIVEALGPFDLDPCAPAVRRWDTARHHFTANDNGLLRAWFGRVWLNPPYRHDLVEQFMGRMVDHGRGTALVNAATDTKWFRRFVWAEASALLFVYQRVRFIAGARELARDRNRFASVLVAYGLDDVDRLAESGIEGAFVPLAAAGQVIAVMRPGAGQTWAALVARLVDEAGGTATLSAVYVLVERHPKRQANPNWQAKIRQVLQGPGFERVERGTYRLRGVA